MGALIVALAGPQSTEIVREISLKGEAIGLVVDLSSSMLAADMEGGATRIEVARNAAVRFAGGRTLDELNLVGFGGKALTRVPPTTDPQLIVTGVESLEVQLVRDGTDISSGLLTSLAELNSSDREPKVVVLLTDGAHNGTGLQPLAAARAAEALGVKVYSISLAGSNLNGAGGSISPAGVRSSEAAEQMETVLAGISAITGGQYFRASTAAELDSIYREIDRLEAPTENVTEREVHHSRRIWVLLLALALLGVDGLLRGTRWGVLP
jgi:Ca-activated chloride channel family protein